MGKAATAEEKSRRVGHNLEVARLPIIDPRNPRQLKRRLDEYFDLCEKNGMFATVAGMSLAIGVTRQTVFRWLSGSTEVSDEMLQILGWGMTVINAQNEGALMDGTGNVVGQIFLTKNNFPGYTDTREVVVQRREKEPTSEELLKIASKLPGFQIEEKK